MTAQAQLTAAGWIVKQVVDDDRETELQVAFGELNGYRRVLALGNAPAVNIATAPADLWTGMGAYPWLAAATALEVVSSSAADAAAGTGARTVLVSALDIDFVEFQEVLTLNGTTPVPMVKPAYRIQDIRMVSGGSSMVNAGTINLRDVAGGTVRAIIPIGYGTARQSQYTVPAGHTLSWVVGPVICINRPTSTRDAAIGVLLRNPIASYQWIPLEVTVDGNPFQLMGSPLAVFPEKTDLGLRVMAVSANATDITGGWVGLLKRNSV